MSRRLERLLEAYRKLQEQEQAKCETLDIKIIELQARRQVMAAPYVRKMAMLDEAIRMEVLKNGAAYVHPEYGKVGYRKGFQRVTWDNGLDELEEDVEVWKKIKKYRRVTSIFPSAKIE